jgi:hypothetical protein
MIYGPSNLQDEGDMFVRIVGTYTHSVTARVGGILDYTAVRTSNLAYIG